MLLPAGFSSFLGSPVPPEVHFSDDDDLVLPKFSPFASHFLSREATSEKMAIGHFFDGKATLVVGTHTHVPTNDVRILINGTAYQTDAGMCGDYDSVIGMNKTNSLNRFLKKNSIKHFPAEGNATLCGLIVECNTSNGLACKVEPFIYGGELIR